jgi:hypothetical protein
MPCRAGLSRRGLRGASLILTHLSGLLSLCCSRHPNYLGEMMFWLGSFLAGLPAIFVSGVPLYVRALRAVSSGLGLAGIFFISKSHPPDRPQDDRRTHTRVSKCHGCLCRQCSLRPNASRTSRPRSTDWSAAFPPSDTTATIPAATPSSRRYSERGQLPVRCGEPLVRARSAQLLCIFSPSRAPVNGQACATCDATVVWDAHGQHWLLMGARSKHGGDRMRVGRGSCSCRAYLVWRTHSCTVVYV